MPTTRAGAALGLSIVGGELFHGERPEKTVILLTEEAGERRLGIWVGAFEGLQVAFALRGVDVETRIIGMARQLAIRVHHHPAGPVAYLVLHHRPGQPGQHQYQPQPGLHDRLRSGFGQVHHLGQTGGSAGAGMPLGRCQQLRWGEVETTGQLVHRQAECPGPLETKSARANDKVTGPPLSPQRASTTPRWIRSIFSASASGMTMSTEPAKTTRA